MRRNRTAVRWENWEQAGGQRTTGSPLAPITFPASPLTVRVEIALGADPAADPSTWSWLDITRWVRYKPGIQITFGRRDESSRVEASQARLTLDNRDGRWSRRNPYGPYFGQLSKNTPIRIGVNPGDGVHYRYHGFVNEWPTRWSDRSATDSTVPIVCGGVLRRMQQASRIKSPMFRTFSGISAGDYVPDEYWPIEDSNGAASIASGLANGRIASVSSNVDLGSYSGIMGSDPIAVINSGGQIYVPFRSYADTGVWQIQFAAMTPSEPASDSYMIDIGIRPGGSGVVKLRIYMFFTGLGGNLRIAAIDNTGAVISDNGMSGAHGQGYVYGITQFQSGGNTVTTFGRASTAGVIEQTSLLYSGAPGMPIYFKAYANSVNAGWALGHVARWSTTAVLTATNIGQNASALDGHSGELAHDRVIRLCREEGAPLLCTSGSSALMGLQATGTLLDNLRACESADGGVLFEHEFGLGYQSLDDRLNAPAQLALDFDSRHIADTPEPADDDQRLTNRAIITRSGGSSSTQQDDESIAAAGVFETSASLNLYIDDQTLVSAGWRVHLGTVDEDRWPAIPIRLHGTPDLIGPWTALPYGSRMTLANPPDEMAPDTIDAVVEGWTERITPHTWDASLNTTPASPYQVGVLATDFGDTDTRIGRAVADSCQLGASVSDSDTSWQVSSTPLWTTTAASFPMDVRVGGEVVRVTTVSGASNPQTWTVTRSINGVVKAHDITNPAEVDVELVHPLLAAPY